MLYEFKCKNDSCDNIVTEITCSMKELEVAQKNGGWPCPECGELMTYIFYAPMHIGEKVKPKSEPKLHVRLK